MKKILLVLLAVLMVLSAFVACKKPEDPENPDEPNAPATEDIYTKSEGVMTYEQYDAAALESQVVVETYIQAKQGWWTNDQGVGVASFYTQDGVGGYFLYDMPCSEEDYNNKLKIGAKIKVTGYKAAWSGEVEIIDATWELLEGNYVAPAKDVTATLADAEALIKLQNMFITVKGATVVASTDKEGTEKAFLYKWDGSGQQGDDIYFNVAVNGQVYGFCVESYLCGKSTDVYKAVEALKVGDQIDLEGFLYWYNGAQPHVTAVKSLGNINAKSEGVMTYEQYDAAALETQVVVETYIQAKQGWWTNDQGVGVASFYTQDGVGGYFLYDMPCSEEDYNNKLKIGAKIKVTGYKAAWSGEVEIIDATWELLDGNYVAPAKDVTATFADAEALIKLQNMFITVKGATVVASTDKEGAEKAFLYKWDGSGQQGDDIYFNVSIDGVTYGFCVESYLCGKSTDVYKAVEALTVGATIDLEGFLYWYNGAQPHVTAVKVAG